MDAFLRRVVEQRELEQEAAIIAAELELSRKCRVCGKRLRLHEGWEDTTVCTRCGGRKRQARLELEDQVVAARRRRQRVLLSVVYPNQEFHVPDEKLCNVCKTPLRSDNATGSHARCKRLSGAAAESAEAPPISGLKGKRSKNTRKNFKVLCAALGFDADELLGEFMQGWIDRIRSSVQLPGDPPRPGDDE